ncbi:MAG: hypothetical protein UR26_C0007G0007 [candidate division TM6 bacterium GW2011_GWF2_32_72]|nr:MAG: hypothetical protein UR26_C0007G0007 [candidate division TM6 bacterium GW2011_GWF2_32_72]
MSRKILLLILFLLAPFTNIKTTTSNNQADPSPVFTTLAENYMIFSLKNYIKNSFDDPSDETEFKRKHPIIGLSVTPFSQTATDARSWGKNRLFLDNTSTETNVLTTGELVNLGDIKGFWNILAMPNTATTCGAPCTVGCNPIPIMQPEDANLPCVFQYYQYQLDLAWAQNQTDQALAALENQVVDPLGIFGFASVPLKYRKSGLRFELAWQILDDIDLIIQTGIVDVKQTTSNTANQNTGFLNLMLVESYTLAEPYRSSTIAQNLVNNYLMFRTKCIGQETGQNFESFSKISLEDINIKLRWTHQYPGNMNNEDYPKFFFIPQVTIALTAPTSPAEPTWKKFAIRAGNNGHFGLSIDATIDFDFFETIQFGVGGGYTYFTGRDINNFYLPNHPSQQAVYPYKTDVNYKPGGNFNLNGTFLAYHFIKDLSFHLRYEYVKHNKDSVSLKKCIKKVPMDIVEKRILTISNQIYDEPVSVLSNEEQQLLIGIDREQEKPANFPTAGRYGQIKNNLKGYTPQNAFLPEKYERDTKWISHHLDIALNYDLSPNLTIGILYQAPIAQKAAYKSWTFMGSITGRF